MENNTRMMLQLAGLLAQNSPASQDERPTTNQTLIAELARQILINTTPTSHAAPSNVQPSLPKNIDHNIVNGRDLAVSLGNQHPHNMMTVRSRSTQGKTATPREYWSVNIPNDQQMFQAVPNAPVNIPRSALVKNSPNVAGSGQVKSRGSLSSSQKMMFAMRMIRMKERKKRGPKEKECFRNYMYCLPDKYARLPKFSSPDPVERDLVRQHQLQGYGKWILGCLFAPVPIFVLKSQTAVNSRISN